MSNRGLKWHALPQDTYPLPWPHPRCATVSFCFIWSLCPKVFSAQCKSDSHLVNSTVFTTTVLVLDKYTYIYLDYSCHGFKDSSDSAPLSDNLGDLPLGIYRGWRYCTTDLLSEEMHERQQLQRLPGITILFKIGFWYWFGSLFRIKILVTQMRIFLQHYLLFDNTK